MWIVLTDAITLVPECQPHHVRAKAITEMCRVRYSDDVIYTCVSTQGGHNLYVTEMPDEIMALMRRADFWGVD